MKPNVLRTIGILFAVAAVLLAIANLKRVADLGMPWLAPLFLVVGAVFLASSRRHRAKSL
jgi:hypothetical protein